MTEAAFAPSPDDVVIAAGARTPQGRIKGQLAALTAAQLGSAAIRGALEQGGIPPEAVDYVIMGQVVQAGCGQNPSKQAAIGAGIGFSVPTQTVNKVCLSGLTAVIEAARLIRLGEAEVVVAGGMESMTHAPHLLPNSRSGWTYGNITAVDALANDGLTDAFDQESMGSSTERHNTRLGITRQVQDEIAAASHQRAAAAITAGAFDAEIAAVEIPQHKGEPVRVTADEGVRPETTAEGLSKLKPAFAADGTITAASSSPLSDGASALVVTSRRRAEAESWPVLAAVRASGQVAGPDNSLQSQPANAIAAALEKEGLQTEDLDFVEINEAFGAVVWQSAEDLGYPLEKINVNGGAIALGHPIGASGARLALTAAHELARRGSGTAAVALCGGGGQGEALILSR